MTNYCHCDPSIKDLRVYYNHDDDFDLMEPQHPFKREGKLWSDPQWRVLPSRLCSFTAHFTQIAPWKKMRQNFLFEDLLDHHDDGALCGTSMFLDRGAECSCLLQDLHHVGTSIPVPLKHILPQRFTTVTCPNIEKDWSAANITTGSFRSFQGVTSIDRYWQVLVPSWCFKFGAYEATTTTDTEERNCYACSGGTSSAGTSHEATRFQASNWLSRELPPLRANIIMIMTSIWFGDQILQNQREGSNKYQYWLTQHCRYAVMHISLDITVVSGFPAPQESLELPWPQRPSVSCPTLLTANSWHFTHLPF